MKKLIFTAFALMLLNFGAMAQNVTTTKDGNYVAAKMVKNEAPGKQTGKTYTDSKGVVYPVFESAGGKLYVIRTSKNGNQYKFYLKLS